MPPSARLLPRRSLLRQSAAGFGLLGLRAMLAAESSPPNPLAPKKPHFPPRVKRVIFLFMHGGPSSIDTFDPKPRLERDNGKPVPFQRGLTFGEGSVNGLMKPLWNFKQYGQSGIAVSELFPHVAECADDLCVVRSMVGDGVDHGAAMLQLHTGVFSFKRPSMGSWILYGLGTENQDLPGFVTIKPGLGHGGQNNWSSSFLPGEYQGTAIGNSNMKLEEIEKEPVPYLVSRGLTGDLQRYEMDMLQKMNRRNLSQFDHDPDLEARIGALELAFRMQIRAPEAFEVEKESPETKKLYGLDNPVTRDFGWQCLLARRLSERGVRFVQCTHSYWDQHSELHKLHTQYAHETDLPIAGLLKDMKARGLFKDTLVLWAGEFGRTPWAQNADGRDHNPYGYTLWMAGAGVKPGFVYGATDEFGYHAVENRMHIHDLHATLLHLFGLQHDKLTYRYAGRDFRLTDVAGTVAQGIIA
jgi:Protein of unknown function (DUF1501)